MSCLEADWMNIFKWYSEYFHSLAAEARCWHATLRNFLNNFTVSKISDTQNQRTFKPSCAAIPKYFHSNYFSYPVCLWISCFPRVFSQFFFPSQHFCFPILENERYFRRLSSPTELPSIWLSECFHHLHYIWDSQLSDHRTFKPYCTAISSIFNPTRLFLLVISCTSRVFSLSCVFSLFILLTFSSQYCHFMSIFMCISWKPFEYFFLFPLSNLWLHLTSMILNLPVFSF